MLRAIVICVGLIPFLWVYARAESLKPVNAPRNMECVAVPEIEPRPVSRPAPWGDWGERMRLECKPKAPRR